jgi:hypothetical protein
MPFRVLSRVLFGALAAVAATGAGAQSGLQPSTALGLDPTFARGWLAPDFDRFGFVTHPWREATGFAPAQRSHWTYSVSPRSSFGMSYANREFVDNEARQMSLYGRYWFSQDWALSAESLSREPGGLLRLQDFRIGVQRRF